MRTREDGDVLRPKRMQCCDPSLRGCMRASITLSLMGDS